MNGNTVLYDECSDDRPLDFGNVASVDSGICGGGLLPEFVGVVARAARRTYATEKAKIFFFMLLHT